MASDAVSRRRRTALVFSLPRAFRRFPLPRLAARHVIVLLTFLGTAICYVERVGFSLAYTAVASRAHVHDATKGWILSAFYYGYATSQIPGSWAAQRIGGRRILTVSFVGWALLVAATPTQAASRAATALLVLLRLLVGVAQGLIFPSIHTVLAQWTPPHERSRSVSLTTSGMYFGAAAAMLLLPPLIAALSPGAVFLATAAMAGAWAVLWARVAADPPGGMAALTPHSPRLPRAEADAALLSAGRSASLSRPFLSGSRSRGSQGDLREGPLAAPLPFLPSAGGTGSTLGGETLATAADAGGSLSAGVPLAPLPSWDGGSGGTGSGSGSSRRLRADADDSGASLAIDVAVAGEAPFTADSSAARLPSSGSAEAAAALPEKGWGPSAARDGWARPSKPSAVGAAIPWGPLLRSPAVWAIVVSNFTFHYALYVLMNWLPTYFETALRSGVRAVGPAKAIPYFLMFLCANVGGIVADHLITTQVLSVGATRKVLNMAGFGLAAAALAVTPLLRSESGAIAGASLSLGACALARAGFAVNHMDIAPRFAGIVMGLSNTAGTVAGVVGVAATGYILEAYGGGENGKGWPIVFLVPSILCFVSGIMFIIYASGDRLFN